MPREGQKKGQGHRALERQAQSPRGVILESTRVSPQPEKMKSEPWMHETRALEEALEGQNQRLEE